MSDSAEKVGAVPGQTGPDGASPEEAMPALSADQLSDLLVQVRHADSIELKLTVPDTRRRSTVMALGMDPLDAQIRQVTFFDTPDLTLSKKGVVVRARRIQGKAGDTVVKLRPLDPSHLSASLRHDKQFGVEIDAMPGGFVCSGSMKGEVKDKLLKEVLSGQHPIRKLFSKEQRALFAAHAPGVDLDALSILGPINILKLKFSPADFGRKMVAELWFYPDNSQILELSTKCEPADAFQVAAESKAFLASHGVDLGAPQQTKTKTAMEFFAAELAASA
jgi:hypothetical protein